MSKKPKLRELPLFGAVRPEREPTFTDCPGCEDWEEKLTSDDLEARAFFTKLQKHIPQIHHTFTTAWMKHQFKKTGNPLYAWHVYAACRKRSRVLPQWVEEYIDGVAQRVIEETKLSPKATEYMLGFIAEPTDEKKGQGKGSGNRPYREFEREWAQYHAPKEITRRLYRHPDKTIDEICQDVAKDLKTVTWQTLKKYYHTAPTKDSSDWDWLREDLD